MHKHAKIAHQFREDRIAAGLPVATQEQLKRAQLYAVGPNRHHNTPLGLEQLALRLPLTKQEKFQNRTREEDAVSLKPLRFRQTQPSADAEQVQGYLASNPGIDDPARAAFDISAMAGYENGPAVALKRVSRYIKSGRKGRVPGHIRAKMVLLSAIAMASELIATRRAPEQPA